MVQCARHNVHNAIWNVQCLAEGFGIVDHFVHHLPRFVVMWRGEHKLLDLFELMYAENAAGVASMAAYLLTEARRDASVPADDRKKLHYA